MRPPKKIAIIGSGGHASVIAEAVSEPQAQILYVVPKITASDQQILETEILQSSDLLNEWTFICGIGITMLVDSQSRESLIDMYKEAGAQFCSVIHKSAQVSSTAIVAENVFIGPLSIINAHAVIEPNCIINSGAIVEHHAVVRRGCHICPGAVLCGGSTIGENSIVAANGVVPQLRAVPDRHLVKANTTFK